MGTNPLDYEHVAEDKGWFRESADWYVYAPFLHPYRIYNYWDGE
jgi:hypothetical protein